MRCALECYVGNRGRNPLSSLPQYSSLLFYFYFLYIFFNARKTNPGICHLCLWRRFYLTLKKKKKSK